jgi:nitrogen fixation protein FixH
MNSSSSARRSPWPIGIAVALMIFTSGLIVLIVVALSSNSDLVVQDYYEQEIRYDEQLDRLARTEAVVDSITIRHDAALGVVILTFPKEHAVPGLVGEVHLYRPSAAGMDRKIPLAVNAAGMQVIPAANLAPGLWQVKVRWTLAGEEYYLEQRLVVPGGAA